MFRNNLLRLRAALSVPVRTALTSVNNAGNASTSTTKGTANKSSTDVAAAAAAAKSAARKSVASKPLTTPAEFDTDSTARSSLLDNQINNEVASLQNTRSAKPSTPSSSSSMPAQNESWSQQPNFAASANEPAVNPSYDGIAFQPFSQETCRTLQGMWLSAFSSLTATSTPRT
jgi:hypothetical protein